MKKICFIPAGSQKAKDNKRETVYPDNLNMLITGDHILKIVLPFVKNSTCQD